MLHTDCTDRGVLSPQKEWYAFRVRARHEKSVALHLDEKREECFAPLIRVPRRWGKRVANVELPLFSGYVFCCSHRFGLLPILTTPGIVDVIRAGNSPVPIPGSEISAIKRVISAFLSVEPCRYVDVGKRVEIQRGPLAGISGIITDCRKHNQLVISVSLIRCSVLVHVNLSDVCGLPSPPPIPETQSSFGTGNLEEDVRLLRFQI